MILSNILSTAGTDTEILAYVHKLSACGSHNGRGYIAPGQGWTPEMLQAGHDLAIACGIEPDRAASLKPSDFLSLYTTARSKHGPSAAKRLAQSKFASPHNPILDPVAPPSASQGLTANELASITAAILDTARDSAMMTTNAIVGEVFKDFPAMVADAVNNIVPRKLEIVQPNKPPVVLDTQHETFPDLLGMLACGQNVYMHGPAGSGKTTAAKNAAKALGLDFYASARLEDALNLLGYYQIHNGEMLITPFRKAFQFGGCFLIDELDDSDPSVGVALNMALANKQCAFLDELVPMHPSFVCIGAGNTELDGASIQYGSRKKLDGSTIDRFKFLEWGYDESFERTLTDNRDWCDYVQAMRKVFKDRGLDQDRIISPRATIDGATMLSAGIRVELVKSACLWKGLDADTVTQVEHACPVKYN